MSTSGYTTYAVVNSYETYSALSEAHGSAEVTLCAISGGLWVATSAVTCLPASEVNSTYVCAGGTSPGAYWLPQGSTQTFKLQGGEGLYVCSDQPTGSITVYTSWITQTSV